MNLVDALGKLFGVVSKIFDWLEVQTIRDDERRQIALESYRKRDELNAQLKAIKDGPDLSRADLFDILCGADRLRGADDTETETITSYSRVASGSDSTKRMRSGLSTASAALSATGETECP